MQWLWSYVHLVENVDLTVLTPRPGHDLALIPFEHDDRTICESGAPDSRIWVVSHVREVTGYNVIGNEVGQGIGVLIGVAWCAGD